MKKKLSLIIAAFGIFAVTASAQCKKGTTDSCNEGKQNKKIEQKCNNQDKGECKKEQKCDKSVKAEGKKKHCAAGAKCKDSK
ncbi:MAG: hypothetical protein ACRC37_05115 [Lentisphaeria bacterium]